MKYTSPYVPPTLTVDAVIFQIINGALNVLLLQRQNDPFKGDWALPGGYSPQGETTLQALERIVDYKAGINITHDLSYVEQLYTFDTVARDPRGHAVSVTYMGCGREVSPDQAASVVSFFPVNSLPPMAYDHKKIIDYAHERLIAKLTYTNAVYAFLPQYFTLAALQSAYEAVFGHELDKRNFRKKFLSLGLTTETDQMQREGAHRPAHLHQFKSDKLETLSRSFD
ncbi:MAG TPA: NUDIX domain-containing protein [Candidatus Microsaccharimonas sp.]|jgi:8-oxo-dGTP diphosphatase